MKFPRSVSVVYQRLYAWHVAVCSVLSLMVYALIYGVCVPFLWMAAGNRKKISHSAWNKWHYKSDTLDELRKQY